MALRTGSRLGVYEIIGEIGAGGMGQVYRARDTKLGRDVAIKALPDLFASDPERLARLQREAQVLASLNHPNIAQIYGLEESSGIRALVMELIPGEDLAARIARGPVPVAEALRIATQIADALEAAHEQGIIHRDLKPANIKVSDDGVVKVLDFGLAKALAPESSASPDAMQSPTLTARATQLGVILGTAAYMSPEQAKGKPVDRRADMWAFGVVLYEMLTGRRAFDGGDISEVLASVIKDAPPLDKLPPDTPAAVRRLLQRCFQKERRERLADAATARMEISEALAAAAPSAAPLAAAPPRRRLDPVTIAGAIGLAALAGVLAWWLKPTPATPALPIARASVVLPANMSWTRLTQHVIAVSPDGTRVGFIANSQLYVRRLDQFDATVISSVRDPSEVFFSWDNEWVGFFAEGKLQKVALTGGTPMTICNTGNLTGAHWAPDNTIVFSLAGQIMRVPAASGTPETIVKRIDNDRLGSPQLLPGGRAVLFSTVSGGKPWDEGEIVVEQLDTHERTVILRGGSDARYVAAGFLVYGRASDLFAVPFDLATLKTRGAPVPLVNGVASAIAGLTPAYQFGISDAGHLAYVSGAAVADLQLMWIGRDGHETVIATEPGASYPRVSPDGTKIAFMGTVAGNSDIFIRERARNARSRLTFDPARDLAPVWTHDSKRIVYASARDTGQNLYVQSADGTGTTERLTTSPNDQYPYAITSDNQTVIYIELSPETSYDIYSVSLTGDRKPKPLLATQFDERRPSLSHDDKWMVYQSNESGAFELFVRPFPNVDSGRWQVSVGGGSSPLWASNGKEIYYRQGQSIMRVGVQTTPEVVPGIPAKFYDVTLPNDAAGMTYAIAPDGSVVAIKPPSGATGPLEYRIVLNWIEDVKARVKVER